MNDQHLIEKTRLKYEFFAKVAIASVTIFLIAPFVFTLIKGIIGLAAAVAISAVIIAITPAVSLAIANLRVSLLKLEATKNPVETLENELNLRTVQLQEKRRSIETSTEKYKTFEAHVSSLKLKYPEEAAKFDDQLAKLAQLLDLKRSAYKTASSDLARFAEVVEKAAAIWQVTQALSAANNSENPTENFYSTLRTKTALDSVQISLNHSFAALETTLLDQEINKTLTNSSSE